MWGGCGEQVLFSAEEWLEHSQLHPGAADGPGESLWEKILIFLWEKISTGDAVVGICFRAADQKVDKTKLLSEATELYLCP